MVSTPRDERCPKIGPMFKIALYKKLQRMAGNSFMQKRRKAKATSWDAFASMLRRIRKVTFQGSFDGETFDISIPEKARDLKPPDEYER